MLAWQQALNDSVDEVIDVAGREGIDAGIVKGGTLHVARNRAQASRLAAEVSEELGWKVDGITTLTKADSAQRIQLDGVVSAYHNPHCARVQPAQLVRGLADTVERLGVDIYERSPVNELRAGRVGTVLGTVSAPVVLRATEGFTSSLPGLKRRWLPMNSSMIATEPIPQDIWETIGWEGRETLGDTAHGFFYAQRTVDDRIAIGGRSVPYRFGSRTDIDGQVPERTIAHLTAVLHSALPQTRDIPVAHAWCGVLAVPRDWEACVTFDKATGLGAAGGYVGHGVTATNLAGRTLTDLVLGRQTPLTDLPWVGHRSRDWEPEPLRWLGVRGDVSGLQGRRLARVAWAQVHLTDRHRRRPDRRSGPTCASAFSFSRCRRELDVLGVGRVAVADAGRDTRRRAEPPRTLVPGSFCDGAAPVGGRDVVAPVRHGDDEALHVERERPPRLGIE